MNRRIIGTTVLALAAGVVLAAAGPRLREWWQAPPHGYCPVCRRHEHGDSVVRVQAAGEGVKEVCCLSCAFNYGRQESKAVTVLTVTDHGSGTPLDPARAAFVVGSDVSPCTHAAAPLRLEGESLPVQWDRCLPSVLAFASGESAGVFQREHGGTVRSFEDLKRQAAEHETLH